MIKGILIVLLTVFQTSFAAQMSAVNFYQTGEVSQLELVFNTNNVQAEKFQVSNNKQIILDLKNTQSTSRVMRAFDTSEFSGAVVFVRAYPIPNSPNDIRVAIQLRDNVRSILERRDNRLVLNIENRYGVFSQSQIEANSFKTIDENTYGSTRLKVPKSNSIEDILENLTLSGSKKYVGKKISIDVKNVSVEDVLKMIADASGFNIIITDEIKKLQPLTLSLNNIPWDQVLDTVLDLNKLVATKNGGILSVITLDKATADKKKELDAKNLAIKQEPLVTKVFPISFGELGKLSEIVKNYLTPERGAISVDERTNYLIVKDTVGTIDKIQKIIETLDKETPQVLIESKIVEVSDGFQQEIGLRNGLGFSYDPIGNSNVLLGNVGTGQVGQQSGPGFSFSSTSMGANSTALGLTVSTFKRVFNLNFNLQLMESQQKVKIVSNPKVIAQNKKPATISEKVTTYFQQQVETLAGSNANNWQAIDRDLNLEVTPQVTNDGSISMTIKVTKQEFGPPRPDNGPPDMTSRDLSTQVLVDNGSTVVIGGVYRQEETESHTGIPLLKDIPIIGWLFRSSYNPTRNKSELVVFITPRIINQKEAGIVQSN